MKVAFLDRERAIAELTDRAQALAARDPRVLMVGLFGSLARGQALPSSDADLLIVLRDHPQKRWFDRISEFSAAFDNTSLPVEVFPYTWAEIARLTAQPGMLRTAVRELIPLAGDKDSFERLTDLNR